METLAQELNPLCAPIKPSKILESMASLAIGLVDSGGGGGRKRREDQPGGIDAALPGFQA